MSTRRSFLASPLAILAAFGIESGITQTKVKEVPLQDRVLVVHTPMHLSHEVHKNIEHSVRTALAEGGYGQTPVLVLGSGLQAYSVPLKGMEQMTVGTCSPDATATYKIQPMELATSKESPFLTLPWRY